MAFEEGEMEINLGVHAMDEYSDGAAPEHADGVSLPVAGSQSEMSIFKERLPTLEPVEELPLEPEPAEFPLECQVPEHRPELELVEEWPSTLEPLEPIPETPRPLVFCETTVPSPSKKKKKGIQRS